MRICYGLFLVDKLKMKQQALKELSFAEQCKPSFDEEFMIFRYRKIIEDEIAESKNENEGKLDMVSEIAFQNRLRQLHLNIEKSSICHMEFWSQLLEDVPDLAKLSNAGMKMYYSINHVEDHLNKLQRVNPNMAKALKLYGKYMIEVINDKDVGQEYLDKARSIANVHYKKIKFANFNFDDISNNSNAMLIVSGEPEKLGTVISVNLACSTMFGYGKSEMINRDIKVFMPNIIAKIHDHYLEQYINNKDSKAMSKERMILVKNKMNYLVPLYIHIKPMQSNNNQMSSFMVAFRQEKYMKNICNIIITKNGIIDTITSNCISVLDIDNKMIKKNYNILTYFPTQFERIDEFKSRTGQDIEYFYPEKLKSCRVNLIATQMKLPGKNGENNGYTLRIVPLEDEQKLATKAIKIKPKPCNFQFQYDGNQHLIKGEFTDNYAEEMLSDFDIKVIFFY